jgi:hypothetical protein
MTTLIELLEIALITSGIFTLIIGGALAFFRLLGALLGAPL